MSGASDTRRESYLLELERGEEGQVVAVALDAEDLSGARRRVRLNGSRALRVVGPLHELVRGRGVTGRAWASTGPIALDQVTGAQAELLLAAVKPMRRVDRIEQVAETVARMGREEASYWHAKSHRQRGLRALRVLVGGRR